jgi:hypothetical protein
MTSDLVQRAQRGDGEAFEGLIRAAYNNNSGELQVTVEVPVN